MTDTCNILKLLHDLKSPLGTLKILEAQEDLKPEHRRILRLTRSFLEDLVRSRTEVKRETMTQAQIRETICQVIQEKQFTHPESLIRLNILVEFPSRPIPGSAIDLRRVVGNLIDNSLNASIARGLNLQVVLTMTFFFNQVVIECRDAAGGLDEDHSRKGWGLGLPIVKDLCRNQNWNFSLDSLPNGTIASISLPCQDGEGAPLSSEVAIPEPSV